jgi:ribosome maturation factor RimP
METNTAQKQPTTGVDLARIREAIAPVLSAHGVDLVDLEWATDRAGWVLRVTIERPGAAGLADPTGGVTLADCADVSHDVSSVLDVEDLIAARYHLEVSSPGLDRPLRSAAEMARFAGRLARVKLSRPAPDGQRVLRGTLAGVSGDGGEAQIAVIVDGKRIEAPFADVAEANLVFELASQPKPGQPKAGQPKKPAARHDGSQAGSGARQKKSARTARSS